MEAMAGARRPELASHQERSRHLVSRLGGELGGELHGDRQFTEICADLDCAVEFAACEGRSVADAIAAYLADLSSAARAQLGTIVWSLGSFVTENLPVMPRAAGLLLRTTEDNTTTRELEEIASSDPVLAAGVLRVANSARFGSRFEINNIRDAVMRVGVPEARKALLASCMERLFASKPLQEIWQHSQFVADSAWEIAGITGVDRETAYVAGLLHDIGRLAFVTAPVRMREAEETFLEAGFPRVYAESLVYQKDHAAFGADLLRKWTIPAGIVEAVEYHHRPELHKSVLQAVLHLAEEMSVRVAWTPEEDLWREMRRRAALDQVGISAEQLSGLVTGKTADIRASA